MSPSVEDLAGNRVEDLSLTWLRDNCPCPRCRDPRNGQKLFQITELPPASRWTPCVGPPTVSRSTGRPTDTGPRTPRGG
ncbi:gamma-butyrobetaine hydroxylase-like domain-containing protein [Streptomyces prunicolor]|uniref:gamma-butyrobetaine hydroxylase-like domain-containing protein n=1 Tax=Streptomyces prunicolor TaxID=67348 RepID=UPI00371B0F91